ncbi:MAG: class I SAM-dependent methyltransferase [Bradyrhizobiaceae bacterium]|nr:class I SAM-dependent methyltransferase [Bradyrhizobiaceae bacterium]
MEHPRIPFISYPYEWSFAVHRAAALLHLDLHLEALNSGFTLSDASAYNVQFRGTRPVFIDHLSLRPYREGELWTGHRQFCMQFLNPLILWSRMRVQPNHWFRGSLEGIAPEELALLLPLRERLSWTIFTHVVAQASLQRRQIAAGKEKESLKRAQLSKNALLGMLSGLRRYISRMRSADEQTVWADYAAKTSYSAEEAATKRDFVEKVVRAVKPALLFDLGCNTGDYSDVALKAGAGYVVGFDFDHATLDRAFERFDNDLRPFLPLWMDAANPSPSQGWAQAERRGLQQRASADALVALAFVHHLAIGRNVPLQSVVEWIMGLAPTGVIEFPSKTDSMVQRLLAHREDIFADYCEEAFLGAVMKRGRVVETRRVSDNGRLLVWYDRRS